MKGFGKYVKKNGIQLLLQALGLLVVILNLWVATKLAPIVQDLAITKQRVSAIEEQIPTHITRPEYNTFSGQVSTSLNDIKTQLDTIIGVLIRR